MELITSMTPEPSYQDSCSECGFPLVSFNGMEIVCEHCGLVEEDKPLDRQLTRNTNKWLDNYRNRQLLNRETNKLQRTSRSYRIMLNKIKWKRDSNTNNVNRRKIFFNEIRRLCGQLELPSLIIRDAELYGEAIIEDLPAYTHLADVLATAVALVWGCSFIYSPRTFQEMISIAHPIASKNKVLQAANKYVFTRLVTASPRMFENKQYTNLVNYYIEHFGAVLNIPYRTVLTAKERFKHLQYKQYTIKPDLQSIAFLLSTYTQKHQTSLKTFKDTVSAIRGYNKGHIMRSLIVECLAKESLTIKQIADKLNRSYQTIYYHIQKLKVLDILETSKVKNAKGRKVTNFTIRTDDKVPLDWKEVTSKCFVSKRSVTRLIKEIQTDVKKTLLHRKPLVTVNHSHSYYHS